MSDMVSWGDPESFRQTHVGEPERDLWGTPDSLARVFEDEGDPEYTLVELIGERLAHMYGPDAWERPTSGILKGAYIRKADRQIDPKEPGGLKKGDVLPFLTPEGLVHLERVRKLMVDFDYERWVAAGAPSEGAYEPLRRWKGHVRTLAMIFHADDRRAMMST